MARNFRYYEKKRGHRRTGSRMLGSLGEAAFFAVLFALGCAGILAGVLWLVIPEWRVNHGFVETTCTVLQKRVGQSEGETGARYRPEVEIKYQAHGTTYRRWTYDLHHAYTGDKDEAAAALEPFLENQKCPCWYDPADPSTAVLVRGYQWWIWLVFLVPVSFVALGVGGLVYTLVNWGKSAERRAAMAQRTQPIELFQGEEPPTGRLPFVPCCSDVTSSPGTRLAYRLPLSRSPAWAFFGLLLACLLWNGALSYFLVDAVATHVRGEPDWLATAFVLPFLAVGIVLIVLFVRHLLVWTGIGPTMVEVSDHPLLPGREYRLLISQSGRLSVRSLSIWLVCEEEATFREGTNTRTETRIVFRQPLLERKEFEIRHGEPFEVECVLCLPEGTMHSFRAAHNAVAWKLIVEGDVARWPDFARHFPLIVHPAPTAAEQKA